jgi:hypothetical protein|tara:strand:- start:22 stop:273 length:252 start_codon:yes stop_codon:yes gene_type:complete
MYYRIYRYYDNKYYYPKKHKSIRKYRYLRFELRIKKSNQETIRKTFSKVYKLNRFLKSLKLPVRVGLDHNKWRLSAPADSGLL